MANKKLVLASYVGKGNQPTESHFAVKEFDDPPLADGEIRLQTLYLSVDPYMRMRMNPDKSYAPPFVVGEALQGSGCGKVIESKNPKYKAGDVLTSQKKLAWNHALRVVFSAEEVELYTLVDTKKVPERLLSATIGWLGMPGLTAYFGLKDIGRPKAGETLVISGAAGACGSVAGQIGKIYNLRVIGIVGTDDKLKYIKDLGFDEGIIYKDKSRDQISAELATLCPKGVDVYYDNVGGEISEAVLKHMNENGRVPVCGQISQYNNPNEFALPPADIMKALTEKKVDRRFFLVSNYIKQYDEGWAEMLKWVDEGKLKCKETVYEGLENVPKAFLGLFQGDNIGKAVVKIA